MINFLIIYHLHVYDLLSFPLQGDLVYVNYGRAEDYLHLKRNFSISVYGKIVIARYGRIARPEKVK